MAKDLGRDSAAVGPGLPPGCVGGVAASLISGCEAREVDGGQDRVWLSEPLAIRDAGWSPGAASIAGDGDSPV